MMTSGDDVKRGERERNQGLETKFVTRHTYKGIEIYVYTHARTHIYTHTHTHTHTNAHVNTYVNTHALTYIHTQTHTHTRSCAKQRRQTHHTT